METEVCHAWLSVLASDRTWIHGQVGASMFTTSLKTIGPTLRLMTAGCLGFFTSFGFASNHSELSPYTTQSGVSVAAQFYQHHYGEVVAGAYFMSNEGPFGGVVLGYTRRLLWDGMFWQIRASFSSGQIDYDSAGTGRIKDTTNNTDDVQLRFIHDVSVSNHLTCSPYYGFGYRVHVDDKSNKVSTTGATGYHRKSEYTYFPIGITAHFTLADAWDIAPYFQWNALYYGRQTSALVIVNNQYKGYGHDLGINLRRHLPSGHLEIGGFYRYWALEDSNLTTVTDGSVTLVVSEPQNTTRERGVVITYHF